MQCVVDLLVLGCVAVGSKGADGQVAARENGEVHALDVIVGTRQRLEAALGRCCLVAVDSVEAVAVPLARLEVLGLDLDRVADVLGRADRAVIGERAALPLARLGGDFVAQAERLVGVALGLRVRPEDSAADVSASAEAGRSHHSHAVLERVARRDAVRKAQLAGEAAALAILGTLGVSALDGVDVVRKTVAAHLD